MVIRGGVAGFARSRLSPAVGCAHSVGFPSGTSLAPLHETPKAFRTGPRGHRGDVGRHVSAWECGVAVKAGPFVQHARRVSAGRGEGRWRAGAAGERFAKPCSETERSRLTAQRATVRSEGTRGAGRARLANRSPAAPAHPYRHTRTPRTRRDYLTTLRCPPPEPLSPAPESGPPGGVSGGGTSPLERHALSGLTGIDRLDTLHGEVHGERPTAEAALARERGLCPWRVRRPHEERRSGRSCRP